MATEKVIADVVDGATPPADSFDLTLDEFCIRLSADKVSPEMIGGFHFAQVSAGKTKSSSGAFSAAFDAFKKQPA